MLVSGYTIISQQCSAKVADVEPVSPGTRLKKQAFDSTKSSPRLLDRSLPNLLTGVVSLVADHNAWYWAYLRELNA
jgi:hypothetical protein